MYNESGVYTSTVTDEPTDFYRIITTSGFCNDDLDEVDEYACAPDNEAAIGLIVTSKVRYKFNNNWHNVELEEWIYDWR